MAFDVLANPAWTTRLRIRNEGGEPMRVAEWRLRAKSWGEKLWKVDGGEGRLCRRCGSGGGR